MGASAAVKTKILVVDDDPNFRETLTDAMALKDVSVSGANGAADACARLKEQRPSLVVLDVQLPDGNGMELCRRIKSDPELRGVPVVMLSGKFIEPADRAEGLMTGADAFLSKPVGLDSLWDEMRYLLDRPS